MSSYSELNCWIVPLHMLQAVIPTIEHGVEEALEKGGIGLYTKEMVLQELANNRWQLWVIQLKNEMVAFMVTSYINGEAPWVEIVVGWADPKKERVFIQALEYIKDFAKLLKCKAVMLYSGRKGMARAVEPAGFKPKMMGYIHRIEDEVSGDESSS